MTQYSFQGYDGKTMTRVVGKNLKISAKKSYEVANFIRGKNVNVALNDLKLVVEEKLAVPYRRYTWNVSHKRGIGQGKYPRNVSIAVAKLIDSLKANAKEKGMDEKKLTIIHAAVHKGAQIQHNGRNRGVRKNAHFELVAKEIEKKKKDDKKIVAERPETNLKVNTGAKSQ